MHQRNKKATALLAALIEKQLNEIRPENIVRVYVSHIYCSTRILKLGNSYPFTIYVFYLHSKAPFTHNSPLQMSPASVL